MITAHDLPSHTRHARNHETFTGRTTHPCKRSVSDRLPGPRKRSLYDRVKVLHSKLMLADPDVMQERERQVELRMTIDAREAAHEER